MRLPHEVLVPGLLLAGVLGGCGSVQSTPDAGASDDAATGDAPTADAAPAVCGDGTRAPGEACYGTPILFSASDVTFDAHLADQDGDGDLDLVYLIGDEYKFHIQSQGQFAPVHINGPTTFSRFAVSIDLGGTSRLELVDAGDQGLSTWGVGPGMNGYVALGQTTQTGTVAAMTVANVTGGATPNVIALYGNQIVVGSYDAALRMTSINGSSPQGARHLTAGRLDSDALADIVVATSAGVLAYRGGALNQTVQTARQAATDRVAIGDVDNDGVPDIVFAAAGANGQLGVMRGAGGAAFLAPTTINVPNLAPVIAIADIDGDGRADVLGARTVAGSNAVLIALGQADGTLATPIEVPIAAVVNYLRVDGDFNGDGVPDLVATDSNAQVVTIFPSRP